MEKETQKEPFIQHGGGILNKRLTEKAKFNDSSAIMETDSLATAALCKPCPILITSIQLTQVDNDIITDLYTYTVCICVCVCYLVNG